MNLTKTKKIAMNRSKLKVTFVHETLFNISPPMPYIDLALHPLLFGPMSAHALYDLLVADSFRSMNIANITRQYVKKCRCICYGMFFHCMNLNWRPPSVNNSAHSKQRRIWFMIHAKKKRAKIHCERFFFIACVDDRRFSLTQNRELYSDSDRT